MMDAMTSGSFCMIGTSDADIFGAPAENTELRFEFPLDLEYLSLIGKSST